MTDQIDLRKPLPSKETPWIEWHGWTTDTTFGWLEQIHRVEPQVHIGDITEGEKKFKTAEQAEKALARAIAAKLADGFEREGEPPPPPAPKPSKPWPKGKAIAPKWLRKAPAAELARVREAIANAKLDHRRADIESLLRPAIRLVAKRAKSVKGVTTRFGGDPDVPAKFAWPKHGKVPLAFLAQYRLDELAKLDLEGALPKRGLLSIFAHLVPDGAGYGEHAGAYYFPDVAKLARAASPRDNGAPGAMATATPSVVLTLPPSDHRAVDSLKLGDERDRYHDDVFLAISHDTPAHQLLGWPNAMTAFDDPLLAQIDSDDRFGFELGDVETLRIHIPAKKLAAHDFRKVAATTSAEP